MAVAIKQTVEPMTLYFGFKMLGVKNFGATEANREVAHLRMLPWVKYIFHPSENDRDNGFDPDGLEGTHEEMAAAGFSRNEALRQDFEWINRYSDGMVVSRTWRKSPGAFAEMAYHQGLYRPVWRYGDFIRTGGDPAKLKACELPSLREIAAAVL
jgi:hypothetical protein